MSARLVKSSRLSTTILQPTGDVLVREGVRIYFAEIAPAAAERLLDRQNTQNRNTNDAQIARLASEMEAGQWKITHQGIAFDEEGILIDGQHRLTAIVKSGRKQTFLVSEGWEPINRVATDHGWMRQLRDDLKIMGITEQPESVAAILNAIRRHVTHTTQKLGFEEAKQHLALYRAGFKWIGGRISNTRGSATNGTTTRAAFVYAYPKIAPMADRLWDDLQTGAGLAANDPILKLRDELKDQNSLRHIKQRVAIFDKALNALYLRAQGKSCKQLKASDAALSFFGNSYEGK